MPVCGECEYYVPRPPEIEYRCTLDGVCLSRGRAVSRKFTRGQVVRRYVLRCRCRVYLYKIQEEG